MLFKLARIVEGRIPNTIKIEDIKGQGYLDRYRKFLELEGNIQVAKKSQLWNEIDIYKLVRNKLTHEGGYLHRNKKSKIEGRSEFKYLIENKVLLAGSYGHIRIRETYFLEKFVTITAEISDALTKEIDKVITN